MSVRCTAVHTGKARVSSLDAVVRAEQQWPDRGDSVEEVWFEVITARRIGGRGHAGGRCIAPGRGDFQYFLRRALPGGFGACYATTSGLGRRPANLYGLNKRSIYPLISRLLSPTRESARWSSQLSRYWSCPHWRSLPLAPQPRRQLRYRRPRRRWLLPCRRQNRPMSRRHRVGPWACNDATHAGMRGTNGGTHVGTRGINEGMRVAAIRCPPQRARRHRHLPRRAHHRLDK